jgi:hypothetical protein
LSLSNIIKTAVVALGLATGAAHATSVHFDVDAHESSAHAERVYGSCWFLCGKSGIEANLVDDIDDTTFYLAEGETSGWFDFFEISVWGLTAGQGYEVSATLAFADPMGSATATGGGYYGTVFGLISGGNLTWDDPDMEVAFGNGGQYTVEFQEGSILGFGNTATVQARVTLDAAPVPLPASALLLLAGLGGLGAVRMRRRTAAAA